MLNWKTGFIMSLGNYTPGCHVADRETGPRSALIGKTENMPWSGAKGQRRGEGAFAIGRVVPAVTTGSVAVVYPNPDFYDR